VHQNTNKENHILTISESEEVIKEKLWCKFMTLTDFQGFWEKLGRPWLSRWYVPVSVSEKPLASIWGWVYVRWGNKYIRHGDNLVEFLVKCPSEEAILMCRLQRYQHHRYGGESSLALIAWTSPTEKNMYQRSWHELCRYAKDNVGVSRENSYRRWSQKIHRYYSLNMKFGCVG